MLKQLSLIDLVSAIQKKVFDSTGMKCYDEIEKDTPSPFFYLELVNKRPNNSKTMYRNLYTFWVHVIAEPTKSSVPVMNYIQKLEEAMTEDIMLLDEYQLIAQSNNGIQVIKTDETNEKHAIIEYVFDICHGFKTKL